MESEEKAVLLELEHRGSEPLGGQAVTCQEEILENK